MNNSIEKYLTHIIKDKNILLFSNKSFKRFKKLFDSFDLFLSNEINEHNINHLNNTLVNDDIDIVIVYANVDIKDVKTSCEIIKNAEKDIVLILILPNKYNSNYSEIINLADIVLIKPLKQVDISKKLFSCLNDKYALQTMKNRENSLRHLAKKGEKKLEPYLDTFEGEILLLSQELRSIVAALDNGELSQELLFEIYKKCEKISYIFEYYNYTKEVAPIFKDLSVYIKKLEIQDVDIKDIDGFEYLARILEDIDAYIIEYFVDRLFVDIQVFEYSLKDSIEFMKHKLDNIPQKESSLEFFND